MARWLRDYLSFGSRRPPPQPPAPDYSGSDFLEAYRAQKSLDFEDPYEEGGSAEPGPGGAPRGAAGAGKLPSPKHRLIRVEGAGLPRGRARAAAAGEGQGPGNSEYSDPFDAQQELRGDGEAEALPENNGYMEPYDAQRVVAGTPPPTPWLADVQCKAEQDGQRVKKSRKGLQLYDTPYEERERDAKDKGRESRLPQDDERPADEYDQPWEWKKDHISRAFAVQFESPDWEPKEHRHPPQTLAGSAKPSRSQSPERSPPMAERVDPSLPLEKQTWYHGSVSRADAENLLTLCKEGSYLVRNSETSHRDYSLSLRSSQGFMHMKFTRTRENRFVLGQNSAPFASVPELVHHYTTRELPVRGAEHLSLLYPVSVQTL